MPLPVPGHIRAANVVAADVRYRWDEWASKKGIYRTEGDEPLLESVSSLSQRGRMALTIGVAEWLVHRFPAEAVNPDAFFAIEAAWAGVIDRNYVLTLASFRDHDEERWSGPVNGVVRRGLLFVNDVIDMGWDNGDNARLHVNLVNLAKYVLPKTDQFESWLTLAATRVRRLSPMLAPDFVGEPVPREALEVSLEFDPQRTEPLIQRFLANINPEQNPFLASRQTMKEAGFAGEPYAFSLEADRGRRGRQGPPRV